MEKYLFMNTVMELIARHTFLRQVCGYALRSIAVVTFFAGVTGFVQIWKFMEEMPGGQIPGAIIFLLTFVVAIYMVLHILWIRSADFFGMPEGAFPISQMAEVFLKTAGEVYAAFALPMAVGGGILIWFCGGRAMDIIAKVTPMVKRFGDYTFTGGVLHIIVGVLYAFLVFLVFYLLAELLVMVVDVTMNLRYTRTVAEQFDKEA